MGFAFTLIFFAIGIALIALLRWIWRLLNLAQRFSQQWKKLQLRRHVKNPILIPNARNDWESYAVFNPAALYEGGRVHLLYRALGPDGISRVGYASSADGIHFDERIKSPVYTPPKGFGIPRPDRRMGPAEYNQIAYTSGGGWGGSEDPRVVKVDDRIYMSFVAFDGWGFIRMALASIDVDDFMQKKWNWTMPTLLSPPDQVHKNWVLFPEKINGKFAIIHSISPNLQIEYVDNFESFDEGHTIGSKFHKKRREGAWDTYLRGAGPPPVKTKDGWLLFYHAVDEREGDRYKLGVMLLDLSDPTKVLSRSQNPILEPDAWYENNGKAGVVYACGAIVMKDMLFVYYGAGDTSVCVATAPIKEITRALVEHQEPYFDTQAINV